MKDAGLSKNRFTPPLGAMRMFLTNIYFHPMFTAASESLSSGTWFLCNYDSKITDRRVSFLFPSFHHSEIFLCPSIALTTCRQASVFMRMKRNSFLDILNHYFVNMLIWNDMSEQRELQSSYSYRCASRPRTIVSHLHFDIFKDAVISPSFFFTTSRLLGFSSLQVQFRMCEII